MDTTDWPRPPIRLEDLPKIRALLTAEEYEQLLKRLLERMADGGKGRGQGKRPPATEGLVSV